MDEDGPADPAIMIADKGYDSNAIRADLDERGVTPMIPARSNRKNPRPIAKPVYAIRNRIERFFNKLKNARRVASRYDKLAESFMGFASNFY
jgi:transposase